MKGGIAGVMIGIATRTIKIKMEVPFAARKISFVRVKVAENWP
jgi:hypothetical protein